MVKIILSTVTNIFYSENKFMARKVIKIINFLVIIILLTTITKKKKNCLSCYFITLPISF